MSGLASTSEVKAVLRARARDLARIPEQPPTGDGSLEVLEFRLAQEEYAIETRYVHEVHPLRHLTSLPSTPEFISGIVNVRGRIVPVVDLKKFFALEETGLTDLHRVILVSGNGLEFGLLADVSVGVRSIAMDALHAAPSTVGGIGTEYVRGVTAERLILLDMQRILSDPRIIVNDIVTS